jgi:hypothetical protein
MLVNRTGAQRGRTCSVPLRAVESGEKNLQHVNTLANTVGAVARTHRALLQHTAQWTTLPTNNMLNNTSTHKLNIKCI